LKKEIEMKKNLLRLAAIAAAVMASQAHAAADTAFTAAVTSTTTDIGTYGAALVGVAAVGVGFMIAIKYVKKISRAA
jgi:uncharacterized protein YraI